MPGTRIIRLLSKLALVGKIDDFCADLAANFESIWEHMVEKFDAKDAKNGNFNNQYGVSKEVYYKIPFMRLTLVLFPLLVFIFSSGCGYRFTYDDSISSFESIAIPYVEGDSDGELTAALIKEVATSGRLRYQYGTADLLLKVRILNFSEKNVGFQYDTKNNGNKVTRSLIPNETRIGALAEVTLIQTAIGKPIIGPVTISASEDYDYYRKSVVGKCDRQEVNVFSLGQFSDEDTGRDAVMQPLNKLLAEKIIDYILNNW